MYLRSLVIKGFKSFADPVTIDLSPGVSVIVGPNGSGKSNIVDAIAWVLGAQGPKTVRSAKMDEVIFAGTENRSPLGRAEVSIVIDNSDGALKLDLSEVTITRTLFRSGESEYALNGNSCRLIDLQELLSDAGVGRQQHVIISQGQLDTILNARSEERRSVVEDAAGITKFKRRRERTERRLDSVEGDLARAADLVREVRRQIRPLAQQAEKAKRQLELRDRISHLKRYIAGAEYRSLETTAESLSREQVEAEIAQGEVQNRILEIDRSIVALEQQYTGGVSDKLVDYISKIDTVIERFRSVIELAQQKNVSVDGRLKETNRSGILESLTAERRSITSELAEVDRSIVALGPLLEKVELDEAQLSLLESDKLSDSLKNLSLRSSEVNAQKARLASEANSHRNTLERINEQRNVLNARRARIVNQLQSKRTELKDVQGRLEALNNSIHADIQDLTLAVNENELALQSLAQKDSSHAQLELKVNTLKARVSAFESAIEEGRAKTQAAALVNLRGCLGALIDFIEIEPGYESAFASAMKDLNEVVLAVNADAAVAGLKELMSKNLDGSVVSIENYVKPSKVQDSINNTNAVHLRSLVNTVNDDLSRFLNYALMNVFVIDGSIDDAAFRFLQNPECVFVTKHGERIAWDGFRTASRPMNGTRIALEKAMSELQEFNIAYERSTAELYDAKQKSRQSAERRKEIEARLVALKGELARIDSLPERLVVDIEHAQRELENINSEETEISERETDAISALQACEPEISNLESESVELNRQIEILNVQLNDHHAVRRNLDAKKASLEVEAAKLEQRRLGLERARESLEQRLDSEEQLNVSLQLERRSLERDLIGLRYVLEIATRGYNEASRISDFLKSERSRLVAETQRKLDELSVARAARTKYEKELEIKRESVQLASIRRSETRVRLETLAERIRRELGIETDIAVATPAPEGINPTQAESIMVSLENELLGLGAINELAEIELAELSERSQFLDSQLEDVKNSRRELIKVIRAIDTEMLAVFEDAFRDVSSKFTGLFEDLFPGGRGSLVLSDPLNPLDSGLEIEVSLPGKRVKRLSLLSGGERSLVALAFLFAIFESRPSPFYILDEVEAALDDINLNRFLRLITNFGQRSQLLIISHQKRTMEVADLLYGVTMQEGGSTKVIAQKLSQVVSQSQ